MICKAKRCHLCNVSADCAVNIKTLRLVATVIPNSRAGFESLSRPTIDQPGMKSPKMSPKVTRNGPTKFATVNTRRTASTTNNDAETEVRDLLTGGLR